MPHKTSPRKDEHLELCAKFDVSYDLISSGFEKISLSEEFSNFSEIFPDMVQLKTSFLKKKVDYPLIISGITGGTEEGKKMNHAIAKVCDEFNIAMGVGSQRAALEEPSLVSTYQVREYAPTIPLISNLGVGQLLDNSNGAKINQAIEMIDADGIALHINPLQEYVQHEGDKQFKNMAQNLKDIVQNSSYPVILKGVGFGFSLSDMEKISEINPQYVDIAGAGGTNWTKIEAYRHENTSSYSSQFLNLGISTVDTLKNAVKVQKADSFRIIASGGVWNGVDAVKALLLGADYVSFALPVVKAFYNNGEVGIRTFISRFIEEMKIVFALMEIQDLESLRKRRKKYILYQ